MRELKDVQLLLATWQKVIEATESLAATEEGRTLFLKCLEVIARFTLWVDAGLIANDSMMSVFVSFAIQPQFRFAAPEAIGCLTAVCTHVCSMYACMYMSANTASLPPPPQSFAQALSLSLFSALIDTSLPARSLTQSLTH
eukprot:GHVU01048045.1.p1 GENE.GHVU01048045.1~~GHVU01048045.1.p1  ORF type:complete len:141 (+),score=13.52 GHVU01048045.1:346-768(+)